MRMHNGLRWLSAVAFLIGTAGPAPAATYKQAINPANDTLVGTYNFDLRFGDTLLWHSGAMDTFTRYMNGNLDSAGNPLVGSGSTDRGAAWRLNRNTGAFLDGPVEPDNINIRSVVQIGNQYFYGTGTGNIRAKDGSLAGAATDNATPGGVVSLVTDGASLWAGGSDGRVRRYSVSGGTLTLTATSAALASAVRGMQLFNSHVYASTGTGGSIGIFDAAGLGSEGTLAGTTIGFNNEGFALFSMGGQDWYIGAEMVNGGLRNALTVRQLTAFDQLSSAADYYRYAVTGGTSDTAFNLVGNNDGLVGLSIDPISGVGYFGSNSNAGVWAYSVSVAPVPEAGSLLMTGLAALGLGAFVRNRRACSFASKEAIR